LEKETISLPDIVDTIGKRPFPLKETLKEYLQELRTRDQEDADAAEEAAKTPVDVAHEESEEKEAQEELDQEMKGVESDLKKDSSEDEKKHKD
jgi:hypothetical protein